MTKLRKKPVVIEAVQFHETKEGIAAILGFVPNGKVGLQHDLPVIRTLEGDMLVNDGDWVIKGVAGEFYPCKPDIFEQTYEKVE